MFKRLYFRDSSQYMDSAEVCKTKGRFALFADMRKSMKDGPDLDERESCSSSSHSRAAIWARVTNFVVRCGLLHMKSYVVIDNVRVE
jgi:hypothetical protein